jgi:hypothetical protein
MTGDAVVCDAGRVLLRKKEGCMVVVVWVEVLANSRRCCGSSSRVCCDCEECEFGMAVNKVGSELKYQCQGEAILKHDNNKPNRHYY